MFMTPTMLLIEDEAAARFGFVRYFSQEGYRVLEAEDLATARKALSRNKPDVVVLDINLPDGNGIEFINFIRRVDPCLPIIVITGRGDIPLAVEAMKRGAENFLTKPVDTAALALFLSKTLENAGIKRHVAAQQRINPPDPFCWGSSSVMAEIKELAIAAANADCPVLLCGDTGTGKGMLARWIQRQSSRNKSEFVEVNCAALRGELLARELFGNARGAYTSADQSSKGLLDIAHLGTLFLDEIGDMDMSLQAQFLKVLEERTYRRLGDTKLQFSDFRVICATNSQIRHLVAEGRFRQDLLYRINLMEIRLPTLPEHLEDLPELASFLLHKLGYRHGVLEKQTLKFLQNYHWPGNIRELHNVLERARILSQGAPLFPKHFSYISQEVSPTPSPNTASLKKLEQRQITTVLAQEKGDVLKAAKRLGISRATLYRRLADQQSGG
jgi:DNA-binding NtrC family response regulator